MSKKKVFKTEFTQEEMASVTFNPAKEYRWQADDQFTFLGGEFQAMFNTMLATISQPLTIENLFKLTTVYGLLENKFKQGMLNGLITEHEKVVQAKD